MQWPPNMKVRPIQSWPGQLARSRQPARFDSSWSSTLLLLGRELRALSARNVVLQVAIAEQDFRIDGYPRAQARAEHPGVILSLDSKHGPLSWPCDTFPTWQDNVRAIALAMEALRKVDRYGVTKRGEQYTGWKALPSGSGLAPSGMTTDRALHIIREEAGVDNSIPGVILTEKVGMREVLRSAKAHAHPDRNGGDRARWNAVDEAEQVLRRAGLLVS